MHIVIANNSSEPIYSQIVNSIKEQILRGQLSEQQALPSIRGLAAELNISVITTKRAYDELENEGYINTVPGKGTYVAAQNKQLLLESRIKLIEEKLTEAIASAQGIDLSIEQLIEMLKILYKENL